jgi:hypothetical protein
MRGRVLSIINGSCAHAHAAHHFVRVRVQLEAKSADLENEIDEVLALYDEKNTEHPAVLHDTKFY